MSSAGGHGLLCEAISVVPPVGYIKNDSRHTFHQSVRGAFYSTGQVESYSEVVMAACLRFSAFQIAAEWQ